MATRISHMVYFELNEPTEQNVQHMLSEMKKYLDDHPGLDFFGCGVLNEELSREVNDKNFHVSLHTVFQDRAAHDAYQVHERHIAFIENNKASWKKVRVFDSNLEG